MTAPELAQPQPPTITTRLLVYAVTAALAALAAWAWTATTNELVHMACVGVVNGGVWVACRLTGATKPAAGGGGPRW